jgi:hypothetical protein
MCLWVDRTHHRTMMAVWPPCGKSEAKWEAAIEKVKNYVGAEKIQTKETSRNFPMAMNSDEESSSDDE